VNSLAIAKSPEIRTSKVTAAEVAITQVNKHFGKGVKRIDVLRDINLSIHAGEILVLLGPSGCGKSTLLRLIAGLENPSEGEITVDGEPVIGVQDRCGFVFQEPRLLPWLSIQDNVRLGARGQRSQEEILELLSSVGLHGFEKHLPRQVSGGMAQRAALARGLAGFPGVLLLDEPFAALDALTRLQMQDLLLEVAKATEATVVLVTHDIDEALHLADRIVVLAERGRGIDEIVKVNHPRPRDRSHPGLAPLRTELLSKFGIHP
jgi:sulfonate transport system ATP-binding protein